MNTPFKMRGWSPFTKNEEKNEENTIGGESLSELITQGRVVNAPSSSEGGVDYTYVSAGKTKAGKSKIRITGEKGPEGGGGTEGGIAI